MNKLYVLLVFIALVACIACQRQQTEERENAVTQDEAKLNPNEKAPEMILTPASSASPSTSPEKRYDLKSQAQKFQPRRIVPMTSPIRETPPSTPASSEAPTEKLNKNETEKQKSDRKEAVQSGEGLSPLPAPGREPSPVQAKVPQGILEPILDKAAELAEVAREQLVMVRAEPAVWNDGSLGCPEPGMMYTQALVNGYWVVIDAAGQTYDFRVDRSGRFQLCPPGRGQPPSQPAAE
jgi:hypothetical protein